MIVLAALIVVAPLSEDRAVGLAAMAMERLRPAVLKRCFAYQVEQSSRRRFAIAVREVHDKQCGGDALVMPVVERLRVWRRPISVDRYDVVNDRWLACRMKGAKPAC